MYEPTYLPQLNVLSKLLPDLRISAIHQTDFLKPDRSNADPLHIHNCSELFLNISSDVSFLVNNQLYPVPVGDVIITRPNEIHIGLFHSAAVQEHVCVWIDADFNAPAFSFLHTPDFCPLFSFDAQTKAQLKRLLLALADDCEPQKTELERLSCLFQVLTILEQKAAKPLRRSSVPKALQTILDDIHEHFSDIRNVNDLLTSHFVSSATLTRWFRTYLQTSPHEYLESVRLSNAAMFLADGCSVTEACLRCGFSDCSRFIILFKKKFGVTPLQYKKRFSSSFRT